MNYVYTIVKLDGTILNDIETLNTYAEKGWELVNVVNVNEDGEVQLAYLKRQEEVIPA